MTKLTDLQSLPLAHAAARPSGSLYALPESVTAEPARVMKAIASCSVRALLEERAVTDREAVHREDGDLRYGAFITLAGLAAIGVEAPAAAGEGGTEPPCVAAAPRPTKAALVLDLLRRDGGATLAELVAATGWLPHTTRAALTGLRKKGHALARERRDGVSHYRIAAK